MLVKHRVGIVLCCHLLRWEFIDLIIVILVCEYAGQDTL